MEIDLGELGKKILLWFIPVLLLVAVVRFCVSSNDSDTSKSSSEINVNGRYTINTGCYGAYTKDSMNQLVKYVTDNNPTGVSAQLTAGELVNLEEGTQVILADYGMTMCKVDIVSGPNAGKTVFVLTEFIQR